MEFLLSGWLLLLADETFRLLEHCVGCLPRIFDKTIRGAGGVISKMTKLPTSLTSRSWSQQKTSHQPSKQASHKNQSAEYHAARLVMH